MFRNKGLWLLILSGLFYMLLQAIFSMPEETEKKSSWPYELAAVQIFRADGTVDGPYPAKQFPIAQRGDRVEIDIPLPEEKYMSDAALCFNIYNSVIYVHNGRDMLYTYGGQLAEEQRHIGSAPARVMIPASAWGKSIRITAFPQEKNAYSALLPVYIMPALDSVWYYLTDNEADFVLMLAVFAVFLMLLLVLAVLPQKTVIIRQGMYLSAFCIFFAAWWMSYTGSINLVIRNMLAASYVQYVCLFALPVPMLMYLRCVEGLRHYKKPLGILAVLGVVLFCIFTPLDFLTPIHYNVFMSYFLAYAGVSAFFVLYICVFRRGGNKSGSEQILRMGVGFLAIAVLLEILRYNLNKFIGLSIDFHTSVGLVIFMVSVIISYFTELMKHLISEQEKRHLERMAYTDVLTELPNRAAGLRFMRDIDEASDYAVAFVDVNGLKEINDNIGHDLGDVLIRTMADMLRKAFKGDAFCFRIGGDEFAAVIPKNGAAAIEQALECLRAEQSAFNAEEGRPFDLSFACGSYVNDPQQPKSLEDALHEADERMYENKIAYKRTMRFKK